jgi:hypothetical protein
MKQDKSMSLEEFRKWIGLENEADFLNYVRDVVVGEETCYAVCEYECTVEPDGYCEHGYPSVLIKIGIH